MVKSRRRTPNDQRSDAFNPSSREYKDRMDHNSDVHNPSSPDFQAALDNRSRQLNLRKSDVTNEDSGSEPIGGGPG